MTGRYTRGERYGELAEPATAPPLAQKLADGSHASRLARVAPVAMNSHFIDRPHATSKSAAMTTENKNLVQRALATLLQTGDVDALAPFLSERFVHHRPDATSRTKPEWLAAVRAALGPLAGMDVLVEHLVADGDCVVMHSRRSLPTGAQIVVIDIWRIEAGLIAEAWEIIEIVAHAAGNFRWWEVAR